MCSIVIFYHIDDFKLPLLLLLVAMLLFLSTLMLFQHRIILLTVIFDTNFNLNLQCPEWLHETIAYKALVSIIWCAQQSVNCGWATVGMFHIHFMPRCSSLYFRSVSMTSTTNFDPKALTWTSLGVLGLWKEQHFCTKKVFSLFFLVIQNQNLFFKQKSSISNIDIETYHW